MIGKLNIINLLVHNLAELKKSGWSVWSHCRCFIGEINADPMFPELAAAVISVGDFHHG
jgi:hypothetical protein